MIEPFRVQSQDARMNSETTAIAFPVALLAPLQEAAAAAAAATTLMVHPPFTASLLSQAPFPKLAFTPISISQAFHILREGSRGWLGHSLEGFPCSHFG